MNKRIVFILALALTTSCGKDSGRGTPSTPEQKSEPISLGTSEDSASIIDSDLAGSLKRKVQLKDDMKNLEEFKANINSWKITFTSPSGSFPFGKVNCEKHHFNQRKNKIFTHFNAEGTEAVVDLEIDERDPAKIEVMCTIFREQIEIGSTSFTIRKSFVVSGKQNLQGSRIAIPLELEKDSGSKIGTLLLEKNAVLNTEGSRFYLEMEELISAGGSIVTFEANKKAGENLPGLAGNGIRLIAKKAQGVVHFWLRGMHAGPQTSVPDAKPARPADSALDGKCGWIGKFWDNERIPEYPHCAGKPGHTGEAGTSGFPGYSGGNTGFLHLMVNTSTSLKAFVHYEVGKGSAGGAGGAGGLGSPGGRGSHVTWQECEHSGGRYMKRGCGKVKGRHYPNGPQGAQGATGLRGQSGKNGEIERSEIRLNDEIFDIAHDWNN